MKSLINRIFFGSRTKYPFSKELTERVLNDLKFFPPIEWKCCTISSGGKSYSHERVSYELVSFIGHDMAIRGLAHQFYTQDKIIIADAFNGPIEEKVKKEQESLDRIKILSILSK